MKMPFYYDCITNMYILTVFIFLVAPYHSIYPVENHVSLTILVQQSQYHGMNFVSEKGVGIKLH